MYVIVNNVMFYTGTKETSYVQAMTSAGIVYSIARACSREKIDQCSCDNKERTAPEDKEFQWGGCGDNLEHGYSYAKKFSAQALTNDASSLLNEHNSEAGRLVSEMNRKFLGNYVKPFCV